VAGRSRVQSCLPGAAPAKPAILSIQPLQDMLPNCPTPQLIWDCHARLRDSDPNPKRVWWLLHHLGQALDRIAMPERHTPERITLVDSARDAWVARLIDTSRRNNLLFFRDLKTGTLDVTNAPPERLGALIAGDAVPLSRLVSPEVEPDPDAIDDTDGAPEERRASARLREIERRAMSNQEERGIQTLFLACGMASWPATDGGKPYLSPILLVPLQAERRGREGAPSVRRAGDLQVNLALLHVLRADYDIDLSADDLLKAAQTDNETDGNASVAADLFEQFEFACRELPGFTIMERAVIGNFSFQKMAMVHDLEVNKELLRAHDLVAALAGDRTARDNITQSNGEPDPRSFDQVPPQNEFFVMDSDSSQQATITRVVAGENLLIMGPPGTGKSQTIVNLIAESAARGRPVLFVAEKRAALEVVKKRLESVGLGHLVLDLHGADISRKAVMARLADALDAVRTSVLPNDTVLHDRFRDRRDKLGGHLERIHRPVEPCGNSVYSILGALLRFGHDVQSTTRWRGAELLRLTDKVARRAADLLNEAGGFETLFLRTDPSAWNGARIPDGEAARQAMDHAARLSATSWPAFRRSLEAACGESRLPAPSTLGEARHLLAVIRGVNQTLANYDAALFDAGLDTIARALEPARGGIFSRIAALFRADYRQARARLRRLRAKAVGDATLLQEASAAARQLQDWKRLAPGAKPRVIDSAEAAGSALQAVSRDLHDLSVALDTAAWDGAPLSRLDEVVAQLASDRTTPVRLPQLSAIESELAALGLGSLVSEIRSRAVPAAGWTQWLGHAWLSSCLDEAFVAMPELAGFNGRTHDQLVSEFADLDRLRIQRAADHVRRAHGERAVHAMNKFPGQRDLVRHEANKRSHHIPLRRLLADAPDVLNALCPCWMVSPLNVSQLLGAERQYFDLVVFDEASQVPPEDAIPALIRGRQVAIAGDRQQLPPTTFFADGVSLSEDGTGAAHEGFESLLDAYGAFLQASMLEWHYRSRDEALIAFSNHHIYNKRLVTFPGTGAEPAIQHVHVPHTPGLDGQEESASAEVERVVQLVLQHAEQKPQHTLGVITMGVKHARRIEAALDNALSLRPDLEAFFASGGMEPFFVKNLERVQGDERDAIILSVGYGKNRAGHLLYNFGPILRAGGERRLNVAVTRARSSMVVVSSFTHSDMDPARSNSKGAEFLRNYLQFAASGGMRLGDAGSQPVELNDFEIDVMETLAGRGIPLLPQWGVGRYRIDLVAQHPTQPGRLVLAIECDGASYHSSPTARERDRLRQQQLEALGWTFHRIWSTDWFLRKDLEVDRALAAYSRAVSDERANAHRVVTPATAPAATLRDRGPRPDVPRRGNISEYSNRELDKMVRWILSDEMLRTEDEIVRETMRELGFTRQGARIQEVLTRAARRNSR
jgi:very-short-patch-repair endonuclease